MNKQKYYENMYMVDSGKKMDCVPQEMTIDNVRLAAAYVPFQFLCELFNPIEALKSGTAFPELFSPYESGKKYKRC